MVNTDVRTAARSRKRTGLLNSRTSHPRPLAVRANDRSGFTATGWPTDSSIGRSVAESEYAVESARSMPSCSANLRTADAFAGPNA